MKRVLSAVATAAITIGFATTGWAQIPNPSFESWEHDTFYYAPDGYAKWIAPDAFGALLFGGPILTGRTDSAIAGNYSLAVRSEVTPQDTLPGVIALKVDPHALTPGPHVVRVRVRHTAAADTARILVLAQNGNMLQGFSVIPVPPTSSDTSMTDTLTVFFGATNNLTLIIQSGRKPNSELLVDSIFIDNTSLPNPGFEQWIPLVKHRPTSWDGMPPFFYTEREFITTGGNPIVIDWLIGDSMFHRILPTTDASLGNYAVRLTPQPFQADSANIDTIAFIHMGDFPQNFQFFPPPMVAVNFASAINAIVFEYKSSNFNPTDTAAAMLFLKVGNQLLPPAVKILTPAGTYTQDTISLTVPVLPDSLNLLIGLKTSSGGQWLQVDNLYASTATGEWYALMDDDVRLSYSSGMVRVEAWPMRHAMMDLTVYDGSGRIVLMQRLTPERRVVEWEAPADGVYLYRLTTPTGDPIRSGRLAVQR